MRGSSDSIRCEQCSTRHVGKHKTEQYFHTMLSATVVADGHNRVIPLMPEFVQPQQDPSAKRPELTEKRRKQDCERNAAKRWLPAHIDELQPYRPVFLGDDLYCCQSLCRLVRNLGADFLFVCKPSSHKRLQEVLHDDFIHSTGWIKARNRNQQVERHRYRWMHGVPVRDSDDAVMGSWVEFVIERNGQRTYLNTFFTSLEVTAANVAEIARAGRARWKIEESFNCLARHGYNIKRNFGHGNKGLANLLATLNLFAFALHEVQDCACQLWRRCRQRAGTRREFFEELRYLTKRECFPNWTVLFAALLEEAPPHCQPPRGRARTVMTQRASHPTTAGLPREPSGSVPRPACQRRLAAALRPGAPGSHSQPPQRLWNGLTPTSTNARWFRHTLASSPKIRIAASSDALLRCGGSSDILASPRGSNGNTRPDVTGSDSAGGSPRGHGISVRIAWAAALVLASAPSTPCRSTLRLLP